MLLVLGLVSAVFAGSDDTNMITINTTNRFVHQLITITILLLCIIMIRWNYS